MDGVTAGANRWDTAEFASDADRDKFQRLMVGISGTSPVVSPSLFQVFTMHHGGLLPPPSAIKSSRHPCVCRLRSGLPTRCTNEVLSCLQIRGQAPLTFAAPTFWFRHGTLSDRVPPPFARCRV